MINFTPPRANTSFPEPVARHIDEAIANLDTAAGILQGLEGQIDKRSWLELEPTRRKLSQFQVFLRDAEERDDLVAAHKHLTNYSARGPDNIMPPAVLWKEKYEVMSALIQATAALEKAIVALQ